MKGVKDKIARRAENTRQTYRMYSIGGGVSVSHDFVEALISAQAEQIKRLESGLNHIMQQGSLSGAIHGGWLLSNIARETLYPAKEASHD